MSDEERTLARNPTSSPGWTWQVSSPGTLVETDESLSWVRCSVEGHAGALVRLTSRDGQTDLLAEAGASPAYGPCYCELGPVGAGWYTLSVEGLGLAMDLWLDGSAPATVSFTSVQKVPHMLLLGRLMANQGNFLALTRYVACFGAVVAFDPKEAEGAKHVILIGAPHLVSKDIEQQVRMGGARVERAEGDIGAQLDRAVESGNPYLSP
jgi:hypothetical protein